MSDDLLTYARETVGLRIGGLYAGRHIGYTTDAGKAAAMRDAGAITVTVTPRTSDGPTGYEVSFAIGSPVVMRVEP